MRIIADKINIPKITDQRPSDTLTRGLFTANAEIISDLFYSYIHTHVDFLKAHNKLARHHNMLNDFLTKFDGAFERWKGYLTSLGTIPNDANPMDLLYLGLWDSAYANDPHGRLSTFGPWLGILGQWMEGKPIGILHAFDQQLTHWHRENLVKAQQLANDLYDHFLEFLGENIITGLKPDYEHLPLIQLYVGGAATYMSGLPVPTIITMDVRKAHQFSGFSALPHEFGHDLSGTFHGRVLVEEITEHVKNLQLPHSELWQLWVEECFADAIGVATIKEGEIFSLANLFSNFDTNIIFPDESGSRHDEHPVRHIRVLVTIEVGRILGLDEAMLNQMEAEWMAFGERRNTFADKIYDQFTNQLYPIEDFLFGVKPVANALVNTAYNHLNRKKVRDIFANFRSKAAEELRLSITDRNWV